MALMVEERSAFEGFMEDIEAPKIDGAFLMSLLEETHGEECFNDEELNIVIRSLETEINANTIMENHEFAMESEFGCRDIGGDLDWNEMEMVLSSQNNDMNLFVEDQIMEFMDESSYSQNYYGVNVPLEENGYSSLWQ
ncbi:hypothetical protein CCACVL1_16575 [Corchorus capsularis]|uniref:Uncharacterized protein n=1 Tax=Corchorus capsularis TaxID=210143 RepID=A0A1R3HW79_COCAP|nr:hypothetical protein CCACVL1_16575 [Corchorus capsularis]